MGFEPQIEELSRYLPTVPSSFPAPRLLGFRSGPTNCSLHCNLAKGSEADCFQIDEGPGESCVGTRDFTGDVRRIPLTFRLACVTQITLGYLP